MKTLLNEKVNFQKLRFWGKIFGIKNNYYIVEGEYDTFDEVDLSDSEFNKYQENFLFEDENAVNEKIPPELVGYGVNQKIFYVSIGSRNSRLKFN